MDRSVLLSFRREEKPRDAATTGAFKIASTEP